MIDDDACRGPRGARRATSRSISLSIVHTALHHPPASLFKPDKTCPDLAADIVHQSPSTRVGRDAVREHIKGCVHAA